MLHRGGFFWILDTMDTWPCRWCFLFLTVPSGYSFKNISTASLYLSSCRLTSDQIRKRTSRVSCFIDCHSLEKVHHKNEKALSDSALDKETVRHISRTYNKLWIAKSCPIRKIIGQHLSEDDFEACLMLWSWGTSSSSFKWLILQLLASSKDLKCSTMTFTSL